ncbi:glutamate 5-kinase [Anaerotardibacter muris]|uniref:glutamate 5-kinase n=1 Tax=Anaerotardibacter muris TaxID=2941505 RepID=UPI00203DB727|nr:glutamate 5-kinase [Anaerotardibacter muris]
MTLEQKKILVVKIGSSTLVNSEGRLDGAYLSSLAFQISAIRDAGWTPIIVTSGSIACGLEALDMTERPSDTPTLQAAASVGTNILVSAYAHAFERYNMLTSVVLITRQITADREQYLHVRDTLERLLDLGVVPIINENDTVSVEQLRFGDNDTLAALVACLVKAQLCVIFSDIDGLYTANPFEDPTATLIEEVASITPELMAVAGGSSSTVGSGGMITKIRAARVLMAAGIDLVICNGRNTDSLVRLTAGERVGTRFSPLAKAHDITPKKLWIALGDTAKGAVIVDEGAREALVSRGSSLLAVGVRGVEGSFAREDIIDIIDGSGHIIARGKAGASSSEVTLACGRSQKEIKGNELLANLAQHPVVHRDDLVVFE